MTALFLKYRPQTFSDLVGQDSVRKTLQNALKAEKPAHAYLFAGSRGTGKTSTARIFAKGLNCTDLKDGDPCGKCDFCIGTAEGSLVDVIEIDAASNRGIDEIRDLREKIDFMPNHAKRKVYIIDEVHMLTKEAFNALLKTLEEPPDHAFFCLATTEMHKIPETIISRCQTFVFQRFGLTQLVDRLSYIADTEGYKYEKEALELVGKKAEGGLRDAISLLEQIAAETDQDISTDKVRESLGISTTQMLDDFYQALSGQDAEAGLEVLKSIGQKGMDLRSFGHDFLDYLRERLFASLSNEENTPSIMNMIEVVEVALMRLKTSPIVELPLEIAVIKLAQGSVAPVEIATKPKAAVAQTAPSKPLAPTPKPVKPKAEAIEVEVPAEKPASEPEPKTVTKEKEEHTPSDQVSTDGMPSAREVKDKMETIGSTSGIAIFARKSFMTSEPKIEGSSIVFYTDSDFHREKLVQAEVTSKLRSAITEVFGKPYPIAFQKGNITRPPAPASSVRPPNQAATANGSTASVDDFLTF